MAQSNKKMLLAKKNKNDEFYTQLTDIEKELKHYREHFNNKIVYCNCDSKNSNFYNHFKMMFDVYNLKKVIITSYSNSINKSNGYILEKINGELTEREFNLRQDGDFRSDECKEILKEADIVVTNPPFSLFREYISQLVEFDKKFLIIGNYASMICKDIFPLIKENKMWLGVSIGNSGFLTPDGSIKTAVTGWFTNLTHKKRNEELILWKKYNEEDYPKYDNYDAIHLDKVADIPCDYDGVMGVPISFMCKHNPNQFEIIGIFSSKVFSDLNLGTGLDKEFIENYKTKGKNVVPFKENDNVLGYYKEGIATIPYARILIRRK